MNNKMLILIRLMALLFIAATLAMISFVILYLHYSIPFDQIPRFIFLILPLGVMFFGQTAGILYALFLLILGCFLLLLKEIARKIFIWIQGINIFLGECFALFAVGWMTSADAGTRFMNFLYLSFMLNILSIVFLVFFMLPIVKMNFRR